jgi:hypothetical protein
MKEMLLRALADEDPVLADAPIGIALLGFFEIADIIQIQL